MKIKDFYWKTIEYCVNWSFRFLQMIILIKIDKEGE